MANRMTVKLGTAADRVLLPIGGQDKAGNAYGVNNKYMMKNGKAILPIMGEFHFSRWTPAEWEEALLKMRAGGVEIVATYVFWIHHEERKGEWDFTGSRDVRAFLEVCKKVGMPVWFRIGPWAHGECRNGGFPDWLVQEQDMETRVDDPKYLEYVRKFWSKLAEQAKGMMCKDGGPILGIQLENEYCHAGGPADKSKGKIHIMTLKKLAMELGFDVPYYTATGWGGAWVIDDEMLPVLGGYVDAPWAAHTHEMPACENFLITPFREDENIATDLKQDAESEYTFSISKNPYLTAELGGGLQVTAHRRTYPFPEDIEAQTMCMLGAGANLLGYYMYHGGYNPKGKYTTLQESKATGYANDYPVRSYDFQTCIRQSGKLNESYHKLKKIHMSILTFEKELATADAYFPEMQPESTEDLQTPRVSVRYSDEYQGGFIFINNHQRLRKMQPIENLSLIISREGDVDVEITNIHCQSGQCALIPFGLQMKDCRLEATNCSLLTKLGDTYFFYIEEGTTPYFHFRDKAYEGIVVLTRQEAEMAYLLQDKLILTKHALYEKDGKLIILAGKAAEQIRYYDDKGAQHEIVLEAVEETVTPLVTARIVKQTGEKSVYELEIEVRDAANLHELYLHMNFKGDRAELYQEDELLDDWFSNGEDWYSAMKRFDYPKKLRLEIFPYKEDVYYDLEPRVGCELVEVCVETEYSKVIKGAN
ncbi:MAG: beta-galactosidase [Lachnospiraceae bacterium]|nr:beta-galactosidase [Lachnospiraceae bacterium]